MNLIKKKLFCAVIVCILTIGFTACEEDSSDSASLALLLLGGGMTYSTGIFDDTFNSGGSGASSYVSALAIQSDGKIIMGGSFTTYNGTDVPDYIIRLNADGSVDTTFNSGGSGASDPVRALAIQSDGKIIVGVVFDSYICWIVPDLFIRLNTDGSVDTTFNSGGSGANSTVRALAIQSNGKVLMGGSFTTYNGTDVPDRVIRLNTDGSVDTTFNSGGSGANDNVRALAIQSDGRVLVGGNFTTYNGTDVPDCVMRLK
jgi:uncharacterized delta-60 repeat protein